MTLICGLVAPDMSYSEDFVLQSYSTRFSVSEETILGSDTSEDFDAYDVSANFKLPLNSYSTWGWLTGTRLMTSAGVVHGAGDSAIVVSVIPELTLERESDGLTLDMGVGGALFSRHRFGSHNYGGPFQFAITLGMAVPVYKKIELGYRFLHYSDAGVNGSDTTGADFHMIELSYGF